MSGPCMLRLCSKTHGASGSGFRELTFDALLPSKHAAFGSECEQVWVALAFAWQQQRDHLLSAIALVEGDQLNTWAERANPSWQQRIAHCATYQIDQGKNIPDPGGNIRQVAGLFECIGEVRSRHKFIGQRDELFVPHIREIDARALRVR